MGATCFVSISGQRSPNAFRISAHERWIEPGLISPDVVAAIVLPEVQRGRFVVRHSRRLVLRNWQFFREPQAHAGVEISRDET